MAPEDIWAQLTAAIENRDVQNGLVQLLVLATMVGVTWAASRLATFGMRRLTDQLFPSLEEPNQRLIRRVTRLVVYVVGGAVGFGLVGVDLSAVAEAFRVLNFELTSIGEHPITLMTPVILVLVWVATTQFSQAAQRAMADTAKMRGMDLDDGNVAVFQRLIHYVALTIGTIVALQILGIDLSSLVAAGAVFAVGVGLALQNLAQNFVSGILLLLERSIKPGDIVEVDGQVVQVRQMGIRSTIGRTRDGEDLIIPNSNLVQNPVKNLTHDDRHIRVRVPVGVAYESDVSEVFRVLSKAAKEIPWRAPGTDPILLWIGFGASSVDFEVSVWGTDPWRLPQLRTELTRAVWDALARAGVTIAFPQLDVHLDAPLPESLRVVGGRDDS